MKTVFIVNPVSGKSDASTTLIPKLIQQSEAFGLDYAIERTYAPKYATKIAQTYASQGQPVRLIACGGDGTLNEVFAGAWEYSNAQVGCIPCGSGNDFIRNFSDSFLFHDLQAQLNGTLQTIDLIQTNHGIAIAICSVGLDAEVANGIPKFRRLPFCGGEMAYQLSIVQQVAGRIGRDLTVITDKAVFRDNFLLAAICNGTTYGGGFCAAPNACLNDGLLDVILIKKVSRFRIAQVIGNYKNGTHIQNGVIRKDLQDIAQIIRTNQLQIYPANKKEVVVNIDGECSKITNLKVEVLKNAAKFILPQGVQMLNQAMVSAN